jgi:malate dehydrogenase (oxaloacetate-decarboxylating)
MPTATAEAHPEALEALEVKLTGWQLLHNPLLNKGSAFTLEERAEFGLEGLLPPIPGSLEQQLDRVYESYRRAGSPIDRHVYLRSLQDRNETLFYALLEKNLEEMLPIVYTPTVGEAIERFSHLYQRPRGLIVDAENISRIDELLSNAAPGEIDLIVATDSEGILGIGDQGFGGLGICIGKLSLYTVAAGLNPGRTLPVVFDVGTDRQSLLDDPLYLGVRQPRLRGRAYVDLISAFAAAVHRRWPSALVQWEDFSKDRAFTVLDAHRDELPSFNDDIQGTGATVLAGLVASMRLSGAKLTDQVFLIHGAGAGGVGVARQIREGLIDAGLSHEEATGRIYTLDSRGLILKDRPKLEQYKLEFARDHAEVEGWNAGTGVAPDLLQTVVNARATALIGLSGQGRAFDREVVEAAARNCERPLVYALSNPTVNTEVLPEDALAWTQGRAIVATGSPFPAVTLPDGRKSVVGQGNNAFIFPGVGLGALAAGATRITDRMMTDAAYALANEVTDARLATGAVFPPVSEMRAVTRKVAQAVAQAAVKEGVASVGAEEAARRLETPFWEPKYRPYRRAH